MDLFSVDTARDAIGTNSVKLDFISSGTVNVVGGTLVPSITDATINGHTHAGPAHSPSGPSHIHQVFTSHQQNIGTTGGTSQSHTHSYSGGTTGDQNQSHTHEMDDTVAAGTGQTGSAGTGSTSTDGGVRTVTRTPLSHRHGSASTASSTSSTERSAGRAACRAYDQGVAAEGRVLP